MAEIIITCNYKFKAFGVVLPALASSGSDGWNTGGVRTGIVMHGGISFVSSHLLSG